MFVGQFFHYPRTEFPLCFAEFLPEALIASRMGSMSRWSLWVERQVYVAQGLIVFKLFDIMASSYAKKDAKYCSVSRENIFRIDGVAAWE
jgi:hypothetical protein